VGYDTFKEPVDSTASLLFMGDASAALSAYVMSTIAELRKDLVVFCSPERADILGTTTQASNVLDYRNGLPSTSYGFMDSGWKKQWDRHNGVNRYIPLNPDCAGLAVATENTMGSFYSPAGYTRGQIRNCEELAWNPSSADRDILYNKGINSVVNFPGEGRLLFGDKTLLAKPNAFDRINVRRLFITLEKSISQAAKQSLFEFNDDFTRTQFTSIVEPFLRDIQARGGITDFMVVCDASNNPPSVVDANQFVGAIYVKPARSINFIELSFVSVRTGVSFSEVVQR
jgi:phage tail sheath protein FI